MLNKYFKNSFIRNIYHWTAQLFDPLKMFCGIKGYCWYLSDLFKYKRISKSENIRFKDMQPELHDRYKEQKISAHYFYLNAWAIRKILKNKPHKHVDIGSLVVFPSMLSAVIPVEYMDYRPLRAKLSNLNCIGGDILKLPYEDNSIKSLSCFHVVEHIGLGRYGDSLDPKGTVKAISELKRVLASGGYLYFALPVGKPRLCFNAHRILSPTEVLSLFSDLELIEQSGVHDDGTFVEDVGIDEFKSSKYACGMFVFKKR